MVETITDLIGAGGDAAPAVLAVDRAALDYAGLRRQVQATGEALRRAGIGRGDAVAIVLPNGPEMATAFVGVAAAAVAAPLNPAYRADEFDFYLGDLDAKALIVAAGAATPAREVAARRGIPLLELAAARRRARRCLRRSRRRPPPEPSAADRPAQAGDTALVLHTSGTTSRPKIVPLSQRNLCASAAHIAQTIALAPADRCLNVMPLFHIHGLMAAVLASFAAGAAVVCTPGFNALRFFAWLDELQPSWYTAVPTMHQAILARAARNPEIVARARLRLIRSSSASLPPQVMADLERLFGCPVIESYGMTEAAHQMASNPLPPAARKPGSVGIAAGPEIAVMAPDGALLPAGTIGEVVIRGPNVTGGYQNNPDANAAAFSRRLVPHRRPGRARRRGLPHDHRAAQGDHQPRRREGRAARGRQRALGASGGRPGADLRGAAPEARRGGRRRGRAARGRARQRERDPRVRRRAPRRLQGAAPHRFSRRDSQGRDRQAAAHRARRAARRQRMRIAVFGAGAIGGYLAVELARAGQAVAVIARRANLAAIRAHGLRLLIGGEERRAEVEASDDPAAIGPVDFLVLAVKANALPGIARALAPAARPRDRGGDRDQRRAVLVFPWARGAASATAGSRASIPAASLWDAIGPERCIGCVVYPACELVEPGLIRHVEGDRFSLGEPDGTRSERASSGSARR